MKRNIAGSVLVALGVILVIAALCKAGSNLWVQEKAGKNAELAMEALIEQIALPTPPQQSRPNDPQSPESDPVVQPGLDEKPDYVEKPAMELPETVIDGVAYVGYLQIPALGLTLPVISESTEEYLNIAPCRFFGTPYQKNFVIGGHRYRKHFSNIHTLKYGERLTFTDVAGNVFTYEVTECEILEPYEAEYLCSGEWDLSLYTCTPGGASRVTVRCEQVA